MRFCSTCGGEIEQRIPKGEDRMRAVCRRCGTIHYVNPKIVVGSVCSFEDRVLICRRAIEPRTGFWTIPAGYMEMGETAEEGAIREAFEEAGARIAIEALMAVYSVRRIDQVQLLYKARLLSPDIAAGPESAEVWLARWDELPWDELAFPTVGWVLRRAIEIRGASGPIVPAGAPEQRSLETDEAGL